MVKLPSSKNSGSAAARGYSVNSTIHTVQHYMFFPNWPRWPPGKSQLTYAFAPENQLTGVVTGIFARAFGRWSEVTPLIFAEVTNFNRADLRIGFFNRADIFAGEGTRIELPEGLEERVREGDWAA